MTTERATREGWFKSSYSNPSQECVEVRFAGGVVEVRDTKERGRGPRLAVPAAAWAHLLHTVPDRLA